MRLRSGAGGRPWRRSIAHRFDRNFVPQISQRPNDTVITPVMVLFRAAIGFAAIKLPRAFSTAHANRAVRSLDLVVALVLCARYEPECPFRRIDSNTSRTLLRIIDEFIETNTR